MFRGALVVQLLTGDGNIVQLTEANAGRHLDTCACVPSFGRRACSILATRRRRQRAWGFLALQHHAGKGEKRMGVFGRGRPSGGLAPALAGIYRIITSGGSLDYIGETNNLARRRAEHSRTGKLGADDKFLWKVAALGSTSTERRESEVAQIIKHCPPGNARAGGGGRPAK